MASGAKSAKPWRVVGWIRARRTAASRPQTQPEASPESLPEYVRDPHDEQMEREWRDWLIKMRL